MAKRKFSSKRNPHKSFEKLIVEKILILKKIFFFKSFDNRKVITYWVGVGVSGHDRCFLRIKGFFDTSISTLYIELRKILVK